MPIEYKVLNVSILAGDPKDVKAQLDYYGTFGWSVCSAVPEFDIIIFKRKIETNEKLREIQLKEGSENGSSETT